MTWFPAGSWDWSLGLFWSFKDSRLYFTSALLLINCISAFSALLLPSSPSLRYLSGRVFVLDLISGSQVDVDKFIRPGDVIDEINGISLRNSKSGQVPSYVPSSFTQLPC